MQPTEWDVIVVGAGVFGAWTAENLRRQGQRVLLVDAWGPGNTRASSGGESRVTRCIYGSDKIYSKMALDSLEDWTQLSSDASLPLFHKTGVLSFFDRENDHANASLNSLQEFNIPIEHIEPSILAKNWPQIDWSGIAFGLYEPSFGVLMARRGVATLVKSFVQDGGSYRQVMITPPRVGEPLTMLRTIDGDELKAEAYVFACGPWLPELFPELIRDRFFSSLQEVFYFRPPGGDTRFAMPYLPSLIEFTDEKAYYALPDIENRGVKIADDSHGPIVDVDMNDRVPSSEMIEALRVYLAMRLPALKNAPLSEARVCQYENSANGDFLIDRHPEWTNATLVGMGSGHGFKHGPAVGKRAAALVLGCGQIESRFSLDNKLTKQYRAVH